MWVVRHLPGKGSNTWAASSGDFDGELTIIFLENTLQTSHIASDCCDYFLIGCDEFQMVKLRKTVPKLESNKPPKLFPPMEMCSVFKFFPAFLHGNRN